MVGSLRRFLQVWHTEPFGCFVTHPTFESFRMNKNVLLAGVSVLIVSACHRPYALYQPTQHSRIGPIMSHSTSASKWSELVVVDSLFPMSLPIVPTGPMLVSTQAGPIESPRNQIVNRLHRVTAWTTATTDRTETSQPKPRRTTAPSHRKSLREMLGLKPRPTLNWWQRIQWQLKASVIVILVAVLFAILGITLLAILFGIIGAVLLVQGLKKSFRTRRPWF